MKIEGTVIKIMQPLVFAKPLEHGIRAEQITSIICSIKPDEVKNTIWERFCIEGILLFGMSIQADNYQTAYPLAMKILMANFGDKVEIGCRGIIISKTAPKVLIMENFNNLTQPYLNLI